MARRSHLLTQLVRYGVRYAPLAYQALKRGQGPARDLGHARLAQRSARAMAVEHAAHLHDGSILPVYDGDARVWVVFSGDEVVGTHPVTRTPTESLLAHYDLSKRMRPATGPQIRPNVVLRRTPRGPQDASPRQPGASGDRRPPRTGAGAVDPPQ